MAKGAWDTGTWDAAEWDSLPVMGNAGTGSSGSVTVNVSKTITQNSSTGSVGTVTVAAPVTAVSLSGNSVTGSTGNVTFRLSDVTVNISAISATGSVGNITFQPANVTVGISGNSAAADVGSVTFSRPEVMLGGHFGFDERDEKWAKEKQLKNERRTKLKTALFGLPIDERKLITSKPFETINFAAQTPVNYDQLMQQINNISANIHALEDELDIEYILEFI